LNREASRKQIPISSNFCNDDSIPAELAMLAQDGRSDNIHFVFDTQRPELLNPSIIGTAYEVVCFRHHGADGLESHRQNAGARCKPGQQPGKG